MFRLITIIFICILSGIEVDLFVPAFPELCQTFQLSPFMVQLTLSINFLAYCVCSLFAGALGDKYNRRHIMLGSLLIFILGSTLCVTAVNFPLLLIGRFLQGAGIAGPAVLAYAIISDDYPLDKQIRLMGIMNGIITISMALAPTLGSYINLYFNWQGNFCTLLILGTLCFIASYFVLPNRPGDATVSLSPATYLPLLQSKKLVILTGCICCLVIPYWVFIGISPILYMQDFGVPLVHFGFYQGALASLFAILSLSSTPILKLFGQRRCLIMSMGLCFISVLLMTVIIISNNQNPLFITIAMLFLTAGVIFPVNILFPFSLTIVENTKSRATALITAIRLIVTGAALQLVGLFYNGTFVLTGLINICFILLGLFFIQKIIRNNWLKWHN